MVLKFNLIVAACENMGIGKNNTLPWRLRTEMDYFTRMTSTTKDKSKMNVVVMGRKTWDSLPKKFKPLADRINFVVSRSNLDLSEFKDSYAFKSLDEAAEKLNDEDFKQLYESVWIIGGSYIYKDAMNSKYFYRLYLTDIKKHFECDTFFPPIPTTVKKIKDPSVSEELQEEKGIQFVYNVYESTIFSG